MPIFKSKQLLDTLEKEITQTIKNAAYLKSMDSSLLTKVPAEGKWSVVQVLYHLNSYNDYYLPHIEQVVTNGISKGYSSTFKAGVIGNYFAKTMLPGNEGVVKNTMKAPKDHTPASTFNDLEAIDLFIAGQNKLLQLINEAREVNMTRLTVPISISKLIKIRLGDTFRFLVAHQQRHFVQISNTLKAIGVAFSV